MRRIRRTVKIGANAVVYRDIPDNAVVALAPGFKMLSYAGNPPPDTSGAAETDVLPPGT